MESYELTFVPLSTAVQDLKHVGSLKGLEGATLNLALRQNLIYFRTQFPRSMSKLASRHVNDIRGIV